jgi:uncharacterized protein YbjT (DUF2867 family)
MVVFVTGASGLIGRSLTPLLLQKGFSVRILLRPGRVNPFPKTERLRVIQGDMGDRGGLAAGVNGTDGVVNLAVNQYHPVLSYEVNVQGVRNLVAAMKRHKVKRLIQMSTLATKIARKGVYASTKAQADELVRNSGLEWTILKPSVVYGSDARSLFGRLVKLVRWLPVVPVFGSGKQVFYPVSAGDVARAVLGALGNPRTVGKVYDIGSAPRQFDEYLGSIAQALGKKRLIIHIPVGAGLLLAHILAKVMPNPPISVDNILGSNQPIRCRPRAGYRDLHYRPEDFQPGISKHLKNLR